MALHLITGYAGKEHITAADQGSFNMAVMGSGQFVLDRGNKFDIAVISNNEIRIYDGDMQMQGRHIRQKENTYATIELENGSQGFKRNDLIVARYTKDSSTGVESADFAVIKGTQNASVAIDPVYNVGDITENGNALINDFPLYRIPIDGLQVGTPERLFDIVPTIDNQLDELVQKVDQAIADKLSGGVATTMEEASASTNPAMLVGTGAINELSTSLNTNFTQSLIDIDIKYDATTGKAMYRQRGTGAFVNFSGGFDNPSVILSKPYSADKSCTITQDCETMMFIVNTVVSRTVSPPDPGLKLNGVSQNYIASIGSQTYANNVWGRVGTWIYLFKDIKNGDVLTFNLNEMGSYCAIGQ